MAVGERKRMGDKYRTAVTATVLTYIETSKERKSDPLNMQKMSLMGSAVLGGEIPPGAVKNPGAKDSVWWVTIDQNGKPTSYRKLADDLSKWRKKLNKQLKAWGETSAVKQLANKRLAAGAIIAGVVCAAVIISVVSFGAGGTALSAAGPLLKGLGAVAKQVASKQGLEVIAAGVKAALPQQAAQMEAEAQATADSTQFEVETSADVDTAVVPATSARPWLIPAAVGLGVVGLVAVIILSRRGGK